MGRLFWKFFFAILFAQLATTVGVGAAFWVGDQARHVARVGDRLDGVPERGFRGPPPDMFGGPDAHRRERPRAPPDGGFRLPYISMAVGTLASLLFAALLAWYFSRPIRALRDAFEAAASGDLAPRFGGGQRRGGDELADLGHDFDRMSGQLRTLMDHQRRLLHDVSHELRSPLARLQAAIGLAHQQPDKLAVSLERIERESARMDKLVGELLTLARLETASGLPATEDIALLELVEEIAADARFEAASLGRHVSVSGVRTAQVRGTPDLLWRAIENVVRNAIKHSPAGGTVEIEVEATPSLALIHVLDRGPGVDPRDLETIFQPFFRSHPAANQIDGHGLGLAIARRVVLAHGGSILARQRDGGGLRVTIAVPVRDQRPAHGQT